jgi:flagellin-like protein
MKRGNSKKGLSPVIATILLIFLVLILAAIIFLWARGFFSEQLEKNGQAIENQCRDIKFKAEKGLIATGNLLTIELSNTGDINMYGISIKEIKGGDEEAHLFVVNLGAGETTSLEFNLESADSERVVVYPVLLGNVVNSNDNKEYTCVENPTTIVL